MSNDCFRCSLNFKSHCWKFQSKLPMVLSTLLPAIDLSRKTCELN